MRKKNFAALSMSLVICLFCCFLLVNGNVVEKYDEEAGKAYLNKINADIQVKTTESVLASWAYESNITDENLKHQLDVSAKLANYTKEVWKETIKYPWKSFKDPDVRRQFQKFSVLGTAILSPPKYKRFNKIISDMQSVYGKAKICNYHNRSDCSLQLEPELTEIFVKSRDPDELRYYWEEWRNAAGRPVREMYKEYVELSNEAAVLNNFTNNADFWLKDYEAKDFKEQVEALWQQLRPLYLQLHAFVRRRLREQYGEQHVTKRGPIPAHLLGNMWAQSWGNVYDFTVPYPGKPSMDVTPNMVEQEYTPLRMFKLAEEFFTSLNLSPMPESFWKNSILEKPTDGRDLICHASAWDFYDGKDFRIKQCTRITMEDLNTVHHEMGHIQYFLQYKNQPLVYKEGTNPGFHEAVGDVMALSVSTPKHLRKIGLLNATDDDAESDINQLYSMALDKIAFLPFGYLMDQWRWSVFEGKTTEKEYNCKWWQLREKYQGLSPSVVRSENDFDPGAKYHTVGNVPYIRYFVSFVIQFQFHRSLCIAAKEFDPNDPASKPLHKCDIYQSKEAGALLKKMLQLGSSKPWPFAMEVMTGQRKMDASALLEYFASLQAWLENENKRTGEFIGWESAQNECAFEREAVTSAKSSDAQGNFEEDNIAYSYAEFVRQDDNSFGFPDYLEEVQPSYEALRHMSKENKIQANYFLPKRTRRKYTKTNKLYPDTVYMQDQKEYVGQGSALQNYKSRLNRQSVTQMQKFPITPFFKKPVHPEKIRLMNAILKNSQYLKTIEDNKRMMNEPVFSYISRRDVEKEEKDKDSASAENTEMEVKEDAKKKIVGVAPKSDTKEELKETNKHTSAAEEPAEKVPELSEEMPEGNKESEAERRSKLVKDNNALGEVNVEPITRTNIRNLEAMKNHDDLLMKAEMIKNEAVKMLRNFNLSSPAAVLQDVNKKPLVLPIPSVDVNKKSIDHSDRSNHPESSSGAAEKQEKGDGRVHLHSDGGLPNSGSSVKIAEKSSQYKDYDLVGVIERLLPFHGNHRTMEDKRRHVHNPRNKEAKYVVLVGNLPQEDTGDSSIGSKKRKKSYKEYHYEATTPVVYNSVVINPGGKAEKSEEGKALSDSRRNSRDEIKKRRRDSLLRERQRNRRRCSRNSFTSSVKDNKFNKNNIVQYFGCLRLLL